MNISHVIIPAAGLGTRFLPFTKSVPKEMLPLLNKPAIEYILTEALQAQLTNVHMIINQEKKALMHYLQHDQQLETELAARKKLYLLDSINHLIDNVTINFSFQEQALGLGHAVAVAKEKIGLNWTAVLLPDDILFHSSPAIAQLITIAQQTKKSVIAVQEVPRHAISAYGSIAIKKQLNENTFEISHVVEKPKPEEAPSCFAIVGRYVFSPSLFPALERIEKAPSGEYQLTDAISLLAQEEGLYAHVLQGNRFDIGTPTGWLAANNALAKFTSL